MRNTYKQIVAAGISAMLLAIVTPARAGVSVVVGAKSPASALTAEQASQLFTSKTATLPGAGAVVLIDQPEGTAARDAFYDKALGKSPQQMKALWSRLLFSGSAQPPKVAHIAADVKHSVNENPNAVGYLDSSDVDGSVKVLLKID